MPPFSISVRSASSFLEEADWLSEQYERYRLPHLVESWWCGIGKLSVSW